MKYLPYIASLVFVLYCATHDVVQDDSQIHARYARNLVEGNGLVWNPGEKVEGSTSLPWTGLMAVSIWVGIDPISTAKVAGVASVVAIMFLMARHKDYLAIPLMLTPWVAFWAVSSMETATFALLVVGAYYYRNLWWLIPLALIRPDGMLIAGLIMLWRKR